MRVLALAVVVGTLAVLCPPAASSAGAASAAPSAITYLPPVDAVVVDQFRPPAHAFGPGNRGLDYGTQPGDDIRAIAPGVVRFAGQVGGILHITVEHPDGLLSTYSGVGAIGVVVGQSVAQGEVIAVAAGPFHLGVRQNGAYIDPASLFNGQISVRLIPESPLVPTSGWRTPGEERAALALVALEMASRGGGVWSGLGNLASGLFGHASNLAHLGLGIGRQLGSWYMDGALTLGGWYLDGSLMLGESLVTVALVVAPVVWHVLPHVVARWHPLVAGVIFGIVIPVLNGEMPPIIGFALDLGRMPNRVLRRGMHWWAHRSHCTPAGAQPPPPSEDRVAVLVAGLDSTSEGASIGDLRTDELGYEPHEVIGFSYEGGQTPGLFGSDAPTPPSGALDRPFDATMEAIGAWPGTAVGLDGISANPYGSNASSTDLAERGVLLADLLTEVVEVETGATVDIFAHSQGGLVMRLALIELTRRPGGAEVIDRLGLVATMATPHHGSDLAAISVMLSGSLAPSAGLRTADLISGTTLHPRGTNVNDLARWSDLIDTLSAHELPQGPSYLSIGNRADYIVPDQQARMPGTMHITLNGTGPFAHSTLPGQDDTTRELALALAGLPQTCQGLGDFLVDVAVTEAVQMTLSGVGASVAVRTLPVAPVDVLEPLVRW